MHRFYSNLILLILFLGVSGCVSVKSTSDYYISYTTTTYPPKPVDFPLPILGRAPDRPYKVIGRLAFRSDQGWRFMRESMLYNARVNGADAVLLKSTDSKENVYYTQVPPRYDWMPMGGPVIVNQDGKKRYCYTNSGYFPIFEPGYTRWWTNIIIGIDAEMIIFKK